MINTIPENAGWMIVGGLAVITALVAIKLIKVVAEMIREYREDDEIEE